MPVRARRHIFSARAGIATVEFALALPMVLLILMGIMEMGLLLNDLLALQHASREGGRAASVGKTTTQTRAAVEGALISSINYAQVTVTLQKRTYTSGAWGTWTTLGDAGTPSVNNAATGDQVRVNLSYSHPLLTRLVLGRIHPDGAVALQTGSVTLRY